MTHDDHENVIFRDNLNLYRHHHAQSSTSHSLTFWQDLQDELDWNVAPYPVNPVNPVRNFYISPD